MVDLQSDYDSEQGSKRLKDDYEAAVKRLHDRHDVLAEGPSRPGDLRVPPQSIAARIADLAQQVAEAAHALDDARGRARAASAQRSDCEAVFAKVSEALLCAIAEHREGPPENVPERP
jgi:hypothetical protein